MKNTKLYRTILYLTQFVINTESINDRVIIKILDLLRIKDGSTRITIIDKFNSLKKDLDTVKVSGDTEILVSKKVRQFIWKNLTLFTILFNVSVLQKLITRRHGGVISIGLVKDLFRVSTGLTGLGTLIPLVKHLLDKVNRFKSVNLYSSTMIIALYSTLIIPDSYKSLTDTLSIYSITYGGLSLLNLLKLKKNIDLVRPGVLLSVALSGIYHNYVVHPELLSSAIKKLVDFGFVGFFESKPEFLASSYEWPEVSVVVSRIRTTAIKKNTKFKSLLLSSNISKIERYQPHPLHTNKILSLTNPSTPNLVKILVGSLPKKFLILFGISLPIFMAWDKFSGRLRLNDDSSIKVKFKRVLPVLLRSMKLSSFLVLVYSTLFTLTIGNNYTNKPIKNFKYIGFISGLWGFLYNESNNLSLTLISYLLRVSLLASKKAIEMRLKSKNIERIVDTVLIGTGLSGMIYLIDNGYETVLLAPTKLTKLLKVMID